MREYPNIIIIDEKEYQYEEILKEDFFSINVLYKNGSDRYVLKLSDFRFIFGILLRPFAILMSRHEYYIYQRVADIPGIPKLGPRLGHRGYFHYFVPGRTLNDLRTLSAEEKKATVPDNFFDQLKAILSTVHEREIFYADLDKRGNIILGDDGKPWLIDFQICLDLGNGLNMFSGMRKRLFARLRQEDEYHLYKQKRRYRPDLLTNDEKELAKRTGFGQTYNRWLGNPYRRLKRNIYPSGSNDLIWYKANRQSKKK